MALATNTTPGSVILKGDMAGTSQAPELRVSGVVAGTYGPANVVVDAKGRIIYARKSDWDNDIAPLFPDATDIDKGKIMVCDPQLSIVGGTVALNMQDATTTLKGKVQVGAGMQVIDGNMEIAYTSVFSKGIMQAGTGLAVTAGELSVVPPIATTTTLGGIIAKDGITVDNEGNLRVDIATSTVTGIVKVGNGLAVDVTGNLTLNTSFATATTATPGIIKVGSGLGVSGAGNLTLDVAGAGGSAGTVKIGTGLAVDGTGNITTPLATTTTKGVVKVGSGLDVDGDGNIHIKYATTSATGIVKIGTGLDVDGTGNATVPVARNVYLDNVIPDVGNNSPYPEDYTLGSVIVPGTGIDLTGDTISVKTASYTERGIVQFYYGTVGEDTDTFPGLYLNCSAGQLSYAFGGWYGGGAPQGSLAPYTPVKPGNGFSVDGDGVLSLTLYATPSILGYITVGGGLAVNASGNLTLNAPIATASTTGIVKVGSGLSVDGIGNVTLNTLPLATTTTTGVVKIGSGLAVDGAGNLTLNAPLATTTTTGVVKIGSGLAVDGAGNLTLNAPIATTTTTGVVKVGSGLAVDGAGNVTVGARQVATASTTGVVKIGSGLAVDVVGNLTLGVTAWKSDTAVTLSAAQYLAKDTLTYASTVNWDGAEGNIFVITVPDGTYGTAVTFTLANGVNVQPGAFYHFVIKQLDISDTVVITYGSQFKFPSSSALRNPRNSVSILSCYAEDTNTLRCIMQPNYI